MSDREQVNIRATVMWAQLNRENDMSGKFQVDLTQLSDGAVEALEGLGIEVGFNEEKQHFITCKSTRPIRARDADGAVMDAETKIGNGSQAVARVSGYEWKFKGKKGTSPSLDRFIITDLVEFEDAVEDMGYVDEAL